MYSTSSVCAWTDLLALLKQPLSFTSSPRDGLLDTEQLLRGHALECAERLALSLSLLSPSHNLATPSQRHPVHSGTQGLPFSMPAAYIHFQ